MVGREAWQGMQTQCRGLAAGGQVRPSSRRSGSNQKYVTRLTEADTKESRRLSERSFAKALMHTYLKHAVLGVCFVVCSGIASGEADGPPLLLESK